MDAMTFASEAALFDYGAEAEMFSPMGRKARRQPLGYRRFAHAAEAIRFAIEELSPQLLVGTYLTRSATCTRAPAIRSIGASLRPDGTRARPGRRTPPWCSRF
jgi:hypothetical protein